MESMGHVYETGRSSVAPELTTFEVQKWASAELLRLQTQEEPENDETVRTWEPPCFLFDIASAQNKMSETETATNPPGDSETETATYSPGDTARWGRNSSGPNKSDSASLCI